MERPLETLLKIVGNDDLESIKSTVRAAAAALGYDRIMLFTFSNNGKTLVDGVYWAEGHWFDEGEAKDAISYAQHCPVARHVLETDEAFFWTKVKTRTGMRYSFVEKPHGPGLHGLQVPVFGHNGLMGAACFGGEAIDGSTAARLTLTQLGVTAFLAARALLEPPRKQSDAKLSPREIEVLQWIAAGKRGADVAATLGLSERTVENHLRHIRQRLEVRTTAQAISAASRLELFDRGAVTKSVSDKDAT